MWSSVAGSVNFGGDVTKPADPLDCEIYRLLENVWFAWAHDVMARSCVLCEKMILRLQHVALCVRGTRKHKNAFMERLNLA